MASVRDDLGEVQVHWSRVSVLKVTGPRVREIVPRTCGPVPLVGILRRWR